MVVQVIGEKAAAVVPVVLAVAEYTFSKSLVTTDFLTTLVVSSSN